MACVTAELRGRVNNQLRFSKIRFSEFFIVFCLVLWLNGLVKCSRSSIRGPGSVLVQENARLSAFLFVASRRGSQLSKWKRAKSQQSFFRFLRSHREVFRGFQRDKSTDFLFCIRFRSCFLHSCSRNLLKVSRWIRGLSLTLVNTLLLRGESNQILVLTLLTIRLTRMHFAFLVKIAGDLLIKLNL